MSLRKLDMTRDFAESLPPESKGLSALAAHVAAAITEKEIDGLGPLTRSERAVAARAIDSFVTILAIAEVVRPAKAELGRSMFLTTDAVLLGYRVALALHPDGADGCRS